MTDSTEAIRRAMTPDMPHQLRAAIDAGEPVWDTDGLRAEFDVIGFAAPFVVVQRKADGAKGSLLFAHSPRHYFGWVAD